jgi:lysine 2,3-aminomutase
VRVDVGGRTDACQVEGHAWWAEHASLDESALRAAEMADASRRTAALQAY